MSIRFRILSIFFLIATLPLSAQESRMGSLITPLPPVHISPNLVQPTFQNFNLRVPEIKFKSINLLNVDSLNYSPVDLTIHPEVEPTERVYNWHYNIFANDFYKSGIIKAWDGGYFSGASSYTTLPTIGTVGMANVGLTQTFGKWTLSTGLTAQKYNFMRQVENTFGLNGMVTYKMNNNVSFSAFGNYQTNGIFNSMAAMPYVSQSAVGGYMSLLTNNQKWGVDLGAQSYYDPYGHQWVTVPIVQPYYNLNGQKLGVDFGGILKQLFMSLSEKSNGSYYNQNYGPANMHPVALPPSGGGHQPMIYIPRH